MPLQLKHWERKVLAILRTNCPTWAKEKIEIKSLIAANTYRVLVLCQTSPMYFANIILMLTIILRITSYYSPHFTDKETEEQRNSGNLPKFIPTVRTEPEWISRSMLNLIKSDPFHFPPKSSHVPCAAYLSFKIEKEQDIFLLFLVSQELARNRLRKRETS